jgi:hypothetical protein
MEQLRQEKPEIYPRRVTGTVVDAQGHPVAGAVVAVGERMRGDSISIVYGASPSTRTAVTGSDGTFDIPDAPLEGAVVAERDHLRAPSVAIADHVRLTLQPTSRIEGKVDLNGIPPQRVTIVARDSAISIGDITYAVVAPVQQDGSFVVDGVQRGKVIVSTAVQGPTGPTLTGVTLDVKQPVVTGVALSLASSSRSVDVIVRSTVGMPLPNAQVAILPGIMPAKSTAKGLNTAAVSASLNVANHVEAAPVPERVALAKKPGDLFATMTNVPDGPASVCALALPADLSDPQLTTKIISHMDKLEVRCAPITDVNKVIVLEVPPLPRLD